MSSPAERHFDRPILFLGADLSSTGINNDIFVSRTLQLERARDAVRSGFLHAPPRTRRERRLMDLCASLEGGGGSSLDALLGNSFANSSGYRNRRYFSGCADVRFLGADPASHDLRGGALDIAHLIHIPMYP